MTTETRNQSAMNLDQMTPLEIVTAMNAEDKKVPVAIEKVLPQLMPTAKKRLAKLIGV